MANAGKIREVGTDGVTVEAATPASQPGDIFPSGVILHYAGSAAPTNWLICDGTAVSRATYAALFAIIGITYGAGDGSTTFNLPDMRGKIAVGKHSSGTFTTLGATGGEENHALSVGEMPSHDHGSVTGVTTPGNVGNENANHQHTLPTTSSLTLGGSGAFHFQNNYVNEANFSSSIETVAHDHNNAAHNHSIPAQGGGASHNNMPPYMVVHHIIKT